MAKKTVSFSEIIPAYTRLVDEHPVISVISSTEIEDTEGLEPEFKKEKVYSLHTKFCLYGFQKCRKGSKCIYAHTFKQLNPIICKWDTECLRKEKCYFKHTSETKVHYVKRAFPEDVKRLHIVLYDNINTCNDNNKTISTKNFIPPTILTSLDDEGLSPEEQLISKQRLRESVKELRQKYYDPIFEYLCWADVNELRDSDDEDY